MKILQLCTKVPYPPKDGGAAGVFVFSKAFAQLGHTVKILAVNPPKHYIDEEQYENLPRNITIHPVNFDTAPVWYKALTNLIFSRLPYQIERFVNKGFANELTSILKQFDPDVVQIEGVYLCPYRPLIGQFSNARIILRAHNIETALWQDIAHNEPQVCKRLYLNIQVRRLMRYETVQMQLTDAVTTVTENDAQFVRNISSKIRCIVAPFGTNLALSEPKNRQNLNNIFFLGALDWLPNQEAIQWFVTQVWPALYEEFPALRFHIAGRNAPWQLSQKLQNTPGVVWHGEISDSVAFINQFSIMVSPLFSGSGIRVKIIEAMQHNIVVIASTKAVEGIDVKHGIHLLLAEDANDYTLQLTRLFSEPGLLKQIAANARQLVCEKFDILAIANNVIGLYNSNQ